jgi:trk system potassium uptake protein TrkA
VAVIGLGRFGVSLSKALYEIGHDVLAIDSSNKVVQSIASKVTHAVQADVTDESVLRDLGLGNFDIAIVTIGSEIQSSVLATILLKKLGVPYVIARAENDLHGTILEKIGADKVIYVEQEMGYKLAHGLTLTEVSDYISIAASYGVVKLTAPHWFVGRSLSELEIGRKGKWNVAIFLIKREKELIIWPEQGEIIRPNDILILAGKDEDLEQALTEVGEEQQNRTDRREPKKVKVVKPERVD